MSRPADDGARQVRAPTESCGEMQIGILETGRSSDDLVARHGAYPDMFARWLGARAPALGFRGYAVFEDEFPASVRECDAWILTGSPFGVYEALPWMTRLEAFVRDAAEAGVPQVGICFGHQIMATAFGGEVRKSERGWGVGVHEAEVVDDQTWMDPKVPRFALRVSHQDQVVRTPGNAKVIASSEFCPVSALAYPGLRAISFQGHPEHEPAFSRDLIELRRGRQLDEAFADERLATLSAPTHEDEVARWVLRFLGAAG